MVLLHRLPILCRHQDLVHAAPHEGIRLCPRERQLLVWRSLRLPQLDMLLPLHTRINHLRAVLAGRILRLLVQAAGLDPAERDCYRDRPSRSHAGPLAMQTLVLLHDLGHRRAQLRRPPRPELLPIQDPPAPPQPHCLHRSFHCLLLCNHRLLLRCKCLPFHSLMSNYVHRCPSG